MDIIPTPLSNLTQGFIIEFQNFNVTYMNCLCYSKYKMEVWYLVFLKINNNGSYWLYSRSILMIPNNGLVLLLPSWKTRYVEFKNA